MVFQWDNKKRQRVWKKRKVDIVYAALIFEGPVLTAIDDREDYGEVREISIGLVDGECFVVVHTDRNGETRIITAWKGGREEHDRYQASIARRDQEDEGSG